MSQAGPGVAQRGEPRAESAQTWEQASFWEGVELELSQVDPADFALFALPVRVSRELEQALWLRLSARLAPLVPAQGPRTDDSSLR